MYCKSYWNSHISSIFATEHTSIGFYCFTQGTNQILSNMW